MDFIAQLAKELPDAVVLSEGGNSAEFGGYIDTGCYMLNAILCGSIFGGWADNKVLGLAGESSAGKTFFHLAIVTNFLRQYEGSIAYVTDTESAITKDMFVARGIDPSRVIIDEPETLQQYKHKALQFADKYEKLCNEARKKKQPVPKVIAVLDSLGQLSTDKEMADSAEGNGTKDMTRPTLVRSAFRTIRLKYAKLQIPLLFTNHTYAMIGSMVPQKEMAGGGGAKYAADTILMLSKAKDREGTEVTGNIITVQAVKSRLSKENSKVKLLLSYKYGLSPYYGLLDLGEKYGMVRKEGKGKYVFINEDGTDMDLSGTERKIYGQPEKFFTKAIMARLEKFANAEFQYGEGETEGFPEEILDEVA